MASPTTANTYDFYVRGGVAIEVAPGVAGFLLSRLTLQLAPGWALGCLTPVSGPGSWQANLLRFGVYEVAKILSPSEDTWPWPLCTLTADGPALLRPDAFTHADFTADCFLPGRPSNDSSASSSYVILGPMNDPAVTFSCNGVTAYSAVRFQNTTAYRSPATDTAVLTWVGAARRDTSPYLPYPNATLSGDVLAVGLYGSSQSVTPKSPPPSPPRPPRPPPPRPPSPVSCVGVGA